MADCWADGVSLFASDMKADFQKHFGALIDPAIPSEKNHWLNFRFLGKVAASVLIVVSVGTASYYIGTRHNQPKSAALGLILRRQLLWSPNESRRINPWFGSTQVLNVEIWQ